MGDEIGDIFGNFICLIVLYLFEFIEWLLKFVDFCLVIMVNVFV